MEKPEIVSVCTFQKRSQQLKRYENVPEDDVYYQDVLRVRTGRESVSASASYGVCFPRSR